MGTSVLLVFLAPLMAVYMLFGSVFESVFGSPTEQVILPYDEEKGIVWEYDNIDDPYIELKETKTDGDEQIFIFENEGNLFTDVFADIFSPAEETYSGDVMDLIFTDKNGNTKTFYAIGGALMSSPEIYSEEECCTLEYTVTAENPKDGANWSSTDTSGCMLVQKPSFGSTETFTVVKTPYAVNDTLDVTFSYSVGIVGIEQIHVYYKAADGEIKVTNERREVYYTAALY